MILFFGIPETPPESWHSNGIRYLIQLVTRIGYEVKVDLIKAAPCYPNTDEPLIVRRSRKSLARMPLALTSAELEDFLIAFQVFSELEMALQNESDGLPLIEIYWGDYDALEVHGEDSIMTGILDAIAKDSGQTAFRLIRDASRIYFPVPIVEKV